MIQAVLLDMDGVVIDSEEFICRAAVKMFGEHGVTVSPADFEPFVGMGEDRYLGGVAEAHGVTIDPVKDKARTYEIYAQIIEGELKPLPGVREFLAAVKDRGLKVALATSADEVKVEASLREIGLVESEFDATVHGLDVARKKPFPDIYLRAAILLGVPPTSCLVVEDSVSGVKAAEAAGARCLALTTSFDAESLGAADWICPDLSEYPAEAIDW
jgi:HAD superfamily hydrolase (TIGR01509 family)